MTQSHKAYDDNTVIIIFTPQYKRFKPLTEGEMYCGNCMSHADNCLCNQTVKVQLSPEQYEKVKSGKVVIHFKWEEL